ncbi:MAG: hypothetical protein AB4060_18750 [Crocosphaera sp.]
MEIVKQLKQIVIILFIFAIVNLCLLYFQSYQVRKLLNYAKEISQALEELDLETLSQLIENFPELRNTLLNQF